MKKRERLKPLSLYPMKLEQALRAALDTKPRDKKQSMAPKKRKSR